MPSCILSSQLTWKNRQSPDQIRCSQTLLIQDDLIDMNHLPNGIEDVQNEQIIFRLSNQRMQLSLAADKLLASASTRCHRS